MQGVPGYYIITTKGTNLPNKKQGQSPGKHEVIQMTGIIINNRNHTIEVTKKFATAAARYGSDEYKTLQEVRRDYPSYKVVTVAHKAAKTTFKGLSHAYMEKYIVAHDDEEKSIMSEFKMLTATCGGTDDMLLEAASYHEIKDWFFDTFPEIKQFHEMRAALLARNAA